MTAIVLDSVRYAFTRRFCSLLCSSTTIFQPAAALSLITAIALAALGFVKASIAFALLAVGLTIFRVVKIIQEEEKITSFAKERGLIQDEMDRSQKDDIVQVLSKVETSSRSALLNDTLSLITPDMDGHDRAQITEILIQIAAPLRPQLIIDAFSFITPEMKGFERTRIIEALHKTEPLSRPQLMIDALSFITPDMKGFEQSCIIEALGALQAPLRHSFITNVKLLITPDMNGSDIAHIVTAMSRVEISLQPSLIAAVTRFIPLKIVDKHSDMSSRIRVRIVEVLSKIKPSLLPLFITQASRLISAGMNNAYRSNICETLSETLRAMDATLWTSFVTDVLKLSYPKDKFWGDSDRSEIIVAFGKIAPSLRAQLVIDALRLITSEMKDSGRASLITALNKIKTDSRTQLITDTLKLITGETDYHNRIITLEILDAIPVPLRESLISAARSLLYYGMHDNNRTEIIQTLKNIPNDERADRVARILKQLADDKITNPQFDHYKRTKELLAIPLKSPFPTLPDKKSPR